MSVLEKQKFKKFWTFSKYSENFWNTEHFFHIEICILQTSKIPKKFWKINVVVHKQNSEGSKIV
jgi:hypothetical protein